MRQPAIIQRSFQGWKIWLAILLGMTVAAWMLYSSISDVRFTEVESGSGTHSWVDSNGNGTIDFDIAEEFVKSAKGNFRPHKLSDVLAHIHWTNYSLIWILVALLCMVGRDFFYIVRIRTLTQKELSWKSGFSVIMLWEFASALSPGVIGGVAVAMFILKRENISLGRSTAIVLITAMMDNLFYVLMIPFVFLFINQEHLFPHHVSSSLGVKWIFWIGFSFFLFMASFLFISIFILPHWTSAALKRLFSLPLLRRWKDQAEKTGKDIELASAILKKERFPFWLKIFLATCGSWISRFLVINAILQAFLKLSFFDHILILGKQLVLWLFMRVSPTPGGSGVAEYAFGELLISFSSSALLLAGLAILWRLISYFPYLFIGAFMLPRWLRKKQG